MKTISSLVLDSNIDYCTEIRNASISREREHQSEWNNTIAFLPSKAVSEMIAGSSSKAQEES